MRRIVVEVRDHHRPAPFAIGVRGWQRLRFQRGHFDVCTSSDPQPRRDLRDHLGGMLDVLEQMARECGVERHVHEWKCLVQVRHGEIRVERLRRGRDQVHAEKLDVRSPRLEKLAPEREASASGSHVEQPRVRWRALEEDEPGVAAPILFGELLPRRGREALRDRRHLEARDVNRRSRSRWCGTKRPLQQAAHMAAREHHCLRDQRAQPPPFSTYFFSPSSIIVQFLSECSFAFSSALLSCARTTWVRSPSLASSMVTR